MFGCVTGACYVLNRDLESALFMGAFTGLGTAIEAAEVLAHAKRRPPIALMAQKREPGAAS